MIPEFRIWDNLTASWYQPTYEAYAGTVEELLMSPSGQLTMRKIDGPSNQMIHESLFPNRFEVSWYTGLKDKNGTKIFEGDIVRYELTREYGANYDPVTLGFIDNDFEINAYLIGRVVVWPSQGVMMTNVITPDPEEFNEEHPVPKRWHVNQKCEVIGNIHENSELLEVQDD